MDSKSPPNHPLSDPSSEPLRHLRTQPVLIAQSPVHHILSPVSSTHCSQLNPGLGWLGIVYWPPMHCEFYGLPCMAAVTMSHTQVQSGEQVAEGGRAGWPAGPACLADQHTDPVVNTTSRTDLLALQLAVGDMGKLASVRRCNWPLPCATLKFSLVSRWPRAGALAGPQGLPALQINTQTPSSTRRHAQTCGHCNWRLETWKTGQRKAGQLAVRQAHTQVQSGEQVAEGGRRMQARRACMP